jgi:2-polyprenyl-6-methoxyphenol hydroxylase-like FAD-dependent oxidoreductase
VGVFDVVVVGGRCAGASVAMLLARAGHRVAIVDRACFPSDTMSTHFVWQRGASQLERWGLLDRLEQRGCRPIQRITFDSGAVRLCGIGPAVSGVGVTYSPRRTVLDTLLVEAAVEAGAELIDGFAVDEVMQEDSRAVGVAGHTKGGRRTSIAARFVVGADGLHSTVARAVGASLTVDYPPLTGVYYSYWSGCEGLGASFNVRPGRLILVWPTNDRQTCVYVGWPRQEFRALRKDPAVHFAAAVKLVPGLWEALEEGRREHRFVGTDDLPNFYRQSVGPGWALVGDAGHHKDPSTGMGMSDAFLAAGLLAEAVDQGLAGVQPIDDATAEYQRRRDGLTANGFDLTLSTARLEGPTPRLERLYRNASDHPDQISRIFGVMGGSIPLSARDTGALL